MKEIVNASGNLESKTLPLIYTDSTDQEEIAKIAEIAKDRRDKTYHERH